ncbi:ATP-binding protein [Nonomuraea pusilla]|uniref:Anti-sigma regulatory factor (Ser/Thr protein kinase) n=1 Tax=Nonomuraea pusilla TaxID=46177 RepID=A0A1H8CNP6_9ACTN|nr:ATP-binding protein [Nonomuraea pusilla]SEM96763.1 Anti-sigma regulatory factor (Ser/Thr protein kinase) [Nonomuraea pusilla]
MRTLLARSFTIADVTPLRGVVASSAASCGLRGPRLEDFVLAVHEAVVNAVKHGGGDGHVRIWTVDGVIRAEISDHGSGIPGGYDHGRRQPPEHAHSGRGIYLINRLCDAADFRTGPDGTTVRMTMRLPRPASARHGRAMKRIRVMAEGGSRSGRFTA